MPMRRHLYHPHWELFSRCVRYVRAGNRCEWCGVPNGTMVPKVGGGGEYPVILTVAHLNHNKADNRPENLAALCQRAHLQLDAGFKRHQRRTDAGQGVLVEPEWDWQSFRRRHIREAAA